MYVLAVILLISLNIFIINGISLNDYCLIDPLNTPCLTQCLRAAQCGKTADESEELLREERQIILDRHNMYRDKVAAGDYSEFQLPGCSGGMNALSYDLELEFIAKCWILQCNFTHDKVRINLAGEKLGQNLHQRRYSSERGYPKDFFTHAIDAWFNEYKLLTNDDAGLVNKFYKKKGTGHLTAMIWGGTKYVGCAKLHNLQKRRGFDGVQDHAYNLYCNYRSKGNYIGAKVYQDKDCSKYNAKYPHLCGEIISSDKKKFIQVDESSKASKLSNSISDYFRDFFHSIFKARN